MSSRLWDKGRPVDETVLRFCVGEDHVLDDRLVAYDVRASQVHARMLAHMGHLSDRDAEALCAALDELKASHRRGEWTISIEEEDVHTALENRLVDRLDDLGGRIHLGRSRNDQILAALRLYLLDVARATADQSKAVAQGLLGLADDQGDIPIPGYTHQQRAMPSSVAQWATGFAAELRDSARLIESVAFLADQSALGSAAGYGTPGLALDRDFVAAQLGHPRVHAPETAVQLSRGKAEAALGFALVTVMGDLGRLASDLCLFTTAEFGFVRLPEAFTTGSSIMPQKRNPDVLELVRAHAAQAPADLAALLATTTRLTSGYHRDLQLLKGPLFRLIDRTAQSLEVTELLVPQVRFDPDRTAAAMDPGLYAAEAAFRLVQEEGVSFREAYRRVAADFASSSD